MKIKSQKDFFAGLMFLVVGGAFAWGATNYTIGEGARMGPGYFPLVLGVILALIGVVVTFQALVQGVRRARVGLGVEQVGRRRLRRIHIPRVSERRDDRNPPVTSSRAGWVTS